MKYYVIYGLFKDTLVVFQLSLNLWIKYLFLTFGKSTYFIKDFHGTSSLHGEMHWFWGKEKYTARLAVVLTPTNPFGNDPEKEEPHGDYTVPQKVPYVNIRKALTQTYLASGNRGEKGKTRLEHNTLRTPQETCGAYYF